MQGEAHMDDFLIESHLEEQPVKKKKSKGFGSQIEEEAVENTSSDEVEIEVEETPIETPVPVVKHHDHSIRPMRRTKPVPKRGEKAATRVRR